MAFEKATQALSGIEEKLRRLFNLAGPIGATFDPKTISVVIAHDLRDPGVAAFAGRSWAWVLPAAGTPAGVNGVSLTPGADVLIEAVYITGQLAANLTIEAYVTTPSEAVGVAGGGVTGAWRDRRVGSGADTPPLVSGNAWGAFTGVVAGANNRVLVWQGAEAASPVRECKIMIPAGGALNFRSGGANASLTVGCWGRVWP